MARNIHDPLLNSLEYICNYFNVTFPGNTLTAGLELEHDFTTLNQITFLCQRLSLELEAKSKKLSQLIKTELPFMLITSDNEIWVHISTDKATGEHTFFNGADKSEVIISQRDLKNKFMGNIIEFNVRPNIDPRQEELGTLKKSWFSDTFLAVRDYFPFIILSSILINLFSFAVPMYIMNVYDRAIPAASTYTVWAFVIGVGIIILFDFVLTIIRSRILGDASDAIGSKMSLDLFKRSLNIMLTKQPSSAGAFLENRRNFMAVRAFLTSTSLSTLIDLPFIIFFLIAVAFIGGWLVLVPIAGIAATLVGNALLEPVTTAYKNECGQLTSLESALQLEAIQNIDTIKQINANQYYIRRFLNAGSFIKNEARKVYLTTTASNLSRTISQITTVSLIIVGAYMVMKQQLTIGGLVGSSIFSARAMAVGQFGQIINNYKGFLFAKKQLEKYMNTEVEEPEDKHTIQLNTTRSDISLRNMTLCYPQQPYPALNNISLDIRENEKIGIIGRTGSGKSSLLKAMIKLYPPQSGIITLDNISLDEISTSNLRYFLHYVSPHSKVLYGSIRDNIVFNSQHATEENIKAVCDLSGLSQYLKKHPKGLDLIIGENTRLLSAGEIQCITICRAILSEAKILLLDEPTANIDNISGNSLIQNLINYCSDKTIIMVTHRPALLKHVDRIVIMAEGSIVADGPRDEIIQKITA